MIPKTPQVSTSLVYVGLYASGTTINSKTITGAIGITATGTSVYSNVDGTNGDAVIELV